MAPSENVPVPPHGNPSSTKRDESPEDLLGDLWGALDVLPAARSTPSLASSTMEMAAVSVARAVPAAKRAGAPPTAAPWRWMVAGVIVSASLAAGFVTGSAGSGSINPNRRSLRAPELAVVIKHLETLEEAGSVGFLEAFSQGDYIVPAFSGREGLWRGRSGGQARPENVGDAADSTSEVDEPPDVPTPELDAAIEDFRRAFLAGEQVLPPPMVEEEPRDGSAIDSIAAVEAAQQFEFNRLAYGELPPSQRDAYLALAEALADPERSDLVEAARLWHAWVDFADPVERAGLIGLPGTERLEWLDRRMRQWRRFMPGRAGDEERSEGAPASRGAGGRGPGGAPRRPGEGEPATP